MDDNAIINLFFSRDESAIAETQQKYAGYLFTVASNILPSIQDAEECVNDAYFKAWEAIPPKRPAFLRSFLARITRNRALDKYRGNNAQKRAGSQVDTLLSELAEVVPSNADVHAEYENNLIAADINAFLQSLSKEARFIFMRRYWYADSISAIAEGFGISESKVKSSLHRARQKLKKRLDS
ncbi:MAG: RNA polymerase sigma factor [Defluviitaleaceae bacterium]|nr:RNA polymerase sigma factor [Defluviitaleaceae bacterium]